MVFLALARHVYPYNAPFACGLHVNCAIIFSVCNFPNRGAAASYLTVPIALLQRGNFVSFLSRRIVAFEDSFA